METQSTKICPYCGETIMAQAVKCRCCKKMLDGSGQVHSDLNEEIKTDVELDSESNDAALNASADGNEELSKEEEKAVDRAAKRTAFVFLILFLSFFWGVFAMYGWQWLEHGSKGAGGKAIVWFGWALFLSIRLKGLIKETFNAEN
ncbi:MAG: hypothetical protein K2H17_08295 [Duncaniella sp.]|uniref:hypothetical protein n=1 Tax=Duncaniella sp. TaxID=2518496 RepID=UPI0023BC60F9|nr:hypothetical protein [Duncaniella sp.]MDE5989384.1 hypothetical protein [Duncaniella sp.]